MFLRAPGSVDLIFDMFTYKNINNVLFIGTCICQKLKSNLNVWTNPNIRVCKLPGTMTLFAHY